MSDEQTATQHQPVFLKKNQVAKLFSVSERTIESWTRQGLIPSIKIGHTVRYCQSAIIQRIQEQQNN